MLQAYLEVLTVIHKVYQSVIENTRRDLGYLGYLDLSPAQGLMLLQIGSQVLSVKDLTARSYVNGVNPHYNMNSLLLAGYLRAGKDKNDKRHTKIQATEKGLMVIEQLAELAEKRLEGLTEKNLKALMAELRRIGK